MEKITKDIEEKFGNKYSVLKLKEVVFDKQANTTSVLFLYPETVEFEDEEKEIVKDFIEKSLNLNSKISIKIKKSFLDDLSIKEKINEFFNLNYKSIEIEKYNNKTTISKNEDGISVNIFLPKRHYDYFKSEKIEGLIEFLKNNFCSEFYIETKLIEDEIDFEEIDSIREKNLETIKIEKSTPRYDVKISHYIIGNDITPKPEYIKNINTEKNSVLLSGKISHLTKKTFIKKLGKDKGEEKAYYTFSLFDGNYINCIFFASKTNEKKMDKIDNDYYVIAMGDVKTGKSDRLSYNIKKLAVCTPVIKEEKVEEQVKDNKIENDLEGYSYVRPDKFHYIKQKDLFDVQKYDEFIMNNDIVVYDLETTGLDSSNCEIIEIGAVKIQKGEITETFQTLIKPQNPIPFTASQINGITDDMVKDCISIDKALPDFKIFCQNCLLTGYNVINFDQKFITNECIKYGLEIDNKVFDTMALVQEKLPLKRVNLSAVVKFLNINLENAHRALYDSLATAKVLLKLHEINN